jgi:hypothetical protein
MLKFVLIEKTSEKVLYRYYPEGGSDFGVVSFDKKSNTCSIITLSDKDKHQRYAMKLFSKIREFAKDDAFDTQGIIAWY